MGILSIILFTLEARLLDSPSQCLLSQITRGQIHY